MWRASNQKILAITHITTYIICLLFFFAISSYYGTTTTGILMHEVVSLVLVWVYAPHYFFIIWIILANKFINVTTPILINAELTTFIVWCVTLFYFLLILRHHNNGNFIDGVAHTCGAEWVCVLRIILCNSFCFH